MTPVLPIDAADLARLIETSWLVAARLHGVDPRRYVAAVDHARALVAVAADGRTVAGEDAAVARALVELADDLASRYVVLEAQTLRVVGWGAYLAEVRGGVPGHCVDIDGDWWHEPGSCPGAAANCDGLCCLAIRKRLGSLDPWHPLRVAWDEERRLERDRRAPPAGGDARRENGMVAARTAAASWRAGR